MQCDLVSYTAHVIDYFTFSVMMVVYYLLMLLCISNIIQAVICVWFCVKQSLCKNV